MRAVVSDIFQILKQGHAQRSSHSRSQLGLIVNETAFHIRYVNELQCT